MAKFNSLTPEEEAIIVNKGTEAPFSGEYDDFYASGLFVCRRCNAPLYESSAKFKSGCGWPSFDAEIPGALNRVSDADGRRTEILCANCEGHLGHVFEGEQHTVKNTRHCVNSLSMKFIPEDKIAQTYDIAVFASGCYWGTEHLFYKADGVIATTVGYAGGTVSNPSYRQVCSGETGHAESVKVVFDPAKTNYEEMVKLFFETHDPTQKDRQGPDIGSQYRSVIFYTSEQQKQIAQKYKAILEGQGAAVVTQIQALDEFYPERDPHHQKYYLKNGQSPYCHIYQKKFD